MYLRGGAVDGESHRVAGAEAKRYHRRARAQGPQARTRSVRSTVNCIVCARSSTDRASDYGSEGWGFESLRARHRKVFTFQWRPCSFFSDRAWLWLLGGRNAGLGRQPLVKESRTSVLSTVAWGPVPLSSSDFTWPTPFATQNLITMSMGVPSTVMAMSISTIVAFW
jgi:hypothetical protein